MTSPTFAALSDAEQTALGDRINSALIGHFHGETEPAALNADPIAGLTHGLGTDMRGIGVDGLEPDPYLYLRAGLTEVYLYVNADDFGEVIAVARTAKVFRVEAETLRADLVEILAWSLCARQPDPAALRSPGLYGEVLRKFLDDQRLALAIFGDRYATLIAAIDAALETP